MLIRVQQEDSEVRDVEDIPSWMIVERIEYRREEGWLCSGRRGEINYTRPQQQPSPTARQHCHAQGAQGRAGRPRQGMECMSGLTNHVAALLGREA